MESPSAAPGKRHISWPGLLLTDPFIYYWYRGEKVDPNYQIATYMVSTQAKTSGPAYSGRETIYPNGSLLVQNVTLEDTGTYTLQVISTDVQFETLTGQIHVYELVTKPSIQVQERDDHVVMSCITNHTGISLHWIFEGHSLQPTEEISLSLNNSSLTISPVRRENVGIYQCEVSNLVSSSQSDAFNLTVKPILTKPNITSNDSNPKEDMDSVTLLCGLDLQDASYMWFRDNQTLPEDDRLQLSQNNWNLTLHNVTRNDTGLYECRTWNPVSDLRSDPFLLNVLYGPNTPTISPSDSYYPSGGTLKLSYQAASNPPAQYFWFINGSYEQAAQNLIIPNITVNDSGKYTCQAYNSATDTNTTTSKLITVSEFVTMPYINASDTTVTENSGPVVLKCFTNHTNIWWIFNKQSLRLTDRMMLSPNNDNLTIDPVKKEDAGDYQCEVYNQVPTYGNQAAVPIYQVSVDYE
ncbi:LOW QUALITY PROTEIN: cell adhesion molecule CEACAM6-like [Rhynchocyon petersi]